MLSWVNQLFVLPALSPTHGSAEQYQPAFLRLWRNQNADGQYKPSSPLHPHRCPFKSSCRYPGALFWGATGSCFTSLAKATWSFSQQSASFSTLWTIHGEAPEQNCSPEARVTCHRGRGRPASKHETQNSSQYSDDARVDDAKRRRQGTLEKEEKEREKVRQRQRGQHQHHTLCKSTVL